MVLVRPLPAELDMTPAIHGHPEIHPTQTRVGHGNSSGHSTLDLASCA